MAVIEQEITERYAVYNGDSCEVLPTLPAASIGFSVYSPPFSELYNYSSSERDLSNCKSYEEFLVHYEFIVREMARLTKPGRINAVHCMDLKKEGQFQRDFPSDIRALHEKHGFHFFGRVTIWKEPLAVAIRTRQLSLMHRQIVKDSTRCKPAGADYLMLFVKEGQNEEPVANPLGLTSYAGEVDPERRRRLGLQPVPAKLEKYRLGWEDPKTNKWAHWVWQQYASPVWMDVRIGHVLPYKKAKETEEEKHVCPLQLDVIERAVQLWSNPGDTVLTPFMGVGSEVYMAAKLGRRPLGIELKPSYYRQAVRNLHAAFESRVEGEGDMLSGMTFEVEEDEAENVDMEALDNSTDEVA